MERGIQQYFPASCEYPPDGGLSVWAYPRQRYHGTEQTRGQRVQSGLCPDSLLHQ